MKRVKAQSPDWYCPIFLWLRLSDTRVGKVGFEAFSNLAHSLIPPLPHLPNGYNGKELCEHQIEKHEEGEAPGQDRPFHPRWAVKLRPDAEPLLGQGGNNDGESFQPH